MAVVDKKQLKQALIELQSKFPLVAEKKEIARIKSYEDGTFGDGVVDRSKVVTKSKVTTLGVVSESLRLVGQEKISKFQKAKQNNLLRTVDDGVVIAVDEASIKERHVIKGRAMEGHHNKDDDFVLSGVRVVFLSAPIFEEAYSRLKVEVEAYDDVNGVPLLVNNPYYFVNPPILVPDGTFYEQLVPTKKDMNHKILMPNVKEDPKLALETIIVQAIKEYNGIKYDLV